MYATNFRSFFLLSAVVIPIDLAAGFAQLWAGRSSALGPATLMIFLGFVQLAAALLASAAIVWAVAAVVGMQPIRLSQAYGEATERFATLWGALWRIVFHVILFGVTIIGIPWAIQRAVRWMFFVQTIVMTGATAKDALSSSASIVVGYWWPALTIAVILWIVAAVPGSLVGVLMWTGPAVVATMVGPFVTAFTQPFLIIGLTLLYFELRDRKHPISPPISAGLAPGQGAFA